MKGTIFERRRAERFAEMLEEADGGRRRHVRNGADADLAPMVAVTHRVAAVPVPVEPDQEFRVGLRAMLMATIERDGIGDTATDRDDGRVGILDIGDAPPEARRSRARVAILVGVTAGALALSGVSAASGDAMPGDALYSIKRNSERAQLALAGSDVSRGNLYLEFARTRLGEAGRVTPDRVGGVLADMDGQTREGVRMLTTAAVDGRDMATLAGIDGFAARQREAIQALLPALDGAGKERAAESVRLLNDIGDRTAELRRSIKCGTGGARLDHLGPIPRPCHLDGPVGNRPRQIPSGGGEQPADKVDSSSQPAADSTETPVIMVPAQSTAEPAATATTAAPPAPATVEEEEDDDGVLDDVGQVLGDILG